MALYEVCSREEARRMLLAHGVRPTHHREGIYAALSMSSAHPTAEELFTTMRKTDPGISLATVYNTLEVLTRNGLCRKIAPATDGSSFRFDADISNHVHVITQDGEVQDVDEEIGRLLLAHLPREQIERIEQRIGMRVERINVELFVSHQPVAELAV